MISCKVGNCAARIHNGKLKYKTSITLSHLYVYTVDTDPIRKTNSTVDVAPTLSPSKIMAPCLTNPNPKWQDVLLAHLHGMVIGEQAIMTITIIVLLNVFNIQC